MITKLIRAASVALVAVGTTVVGLPGGAHAASSLPCAQITGGGPSYTAPTSTTSTTTGDSGDGVTTTTTTVTGPGTFATSVELGGITCPGATYTFTMSSPDATNLFWTTTSAAGTAVPPTTTESKFGAAVSVAFTGDGTSSKLTLTGTTGTASAFYRGLCVNSYVTISVAGQTQVMSTVVPACTGTSGGSTYLG